MYICYPQKIHIEYSDDSNDIMNKQPPTGLPVTMSWVMVLTERYTSKNYGTHWNSHKNPADMVMFGKIPKKVKNTQCKPVYPESFKFNQEFSHPGLLLLSILNLLLHVP